MLLICFQSQSGQRTDIQGNVGIRRVVQEPPLSGEETTFLSSKCHPRDREKERETKKREITRPSTREGRANFSVEGSSLTVDIILGCVVVSTLEDSVRSIIDFRKVVVFCNFLVFPQLFGIVFSFCYLSCEE